MTVEVEGADEAAAAIEAIGADARTMPAAHRRIADAGERAARARAPVRTGALVGSIDGRSSDVDATLAVGVGYWRAPEFGTRRNRARHYLEAGTEAMRAIAPEAYRAELEATIERHT